MRAGEPSARLVNVEGGGEDLGHARGLLRHYAAEHGPLVSVIVDVQGFDAEVAGLPGRYAPPSGCLVLAMDGDIPAGCVALRVLGGGTCEMRRLYDAAGHRDLGLGRLLVEEIVRRAEDQRYRRMVLDTLPEMAMAVALHRAIGFVEAAPYRDCPVERTVAMGRTLGHTGSWTSGVGLEA